MTRDATLTTTDRVTTPRDSDSQAHASTHDIANRFVQTYSQTRIDPGFAHPFAETAEVWHNIDHRTMTLPGGEFAGAMLRMLSAAPQVLRGHCDRVWSLQIGHSGFALAATARATSTVIRCTSPDA